MLGWMISVYRQIEGGKIPATPGSALGPEMAVWQTGMDGLDWLDALAESGSALCLGGNGYPLRYTALAGHAIAIIRRGPPEANDVWVAGEHDTLATNWYGTTHLDEALLAQCRQDEWLMFEAWDES